MGSAVPGRPGVVPYDSEAASPKASAELVSVRAVSTTTADDGSVRLTIETTSKVKPGAGLPVALANERLRQAVARQAGRVADGLGRVVATDVVAVEMPDPAKLAGRPWTVTARFVVTHRLV